MEKIPILKVGKFLLITVQSDLHGHSGERLLEDLSKMIAETEAQGVMLDVSAVNIIDSFIGRVIGNIAMISKVLDADTVVVGMQPAVAITIVELGLPWNGIFTALNVEQGMQVLREQVQQRNHISGNQ